MEMGRNAGQKPFQLGPMPFPSVDPALGWAPGTPSLCPQSVTAHCTHRSRCLAHCHGHRLLRGMGSGSRRGGRLVQWEGESGNLSQTAMGILATHPRKCVLSPPPLQAHLLLRLPSRGWLKAPHCGSHNGSPRLEEREADQCPPKPDKRDWN